MGDYDGAQPEGCRAEGVCILAAMKSQFDILSRRLVGVSLTWDDSLHQGWDYMFA